ncbi:MAG: hypothetical protein JXQ75_02290, partial [Phycisphaerae bacterium]|nr:hypothetical protein [Phycisphaerae bacterium]
TDGFSVLQAEGGRLPELAGDAPLGFRDGKTFVLSVKLAPDTAYAVGLNSARRQGFRSADGSPLPPAVIRFRTGPGGVTPKRGGWGTPVDSDATSGSGSGQGKGGWGTPDDGSDRGVKTGKGGWGTAGDSPTGPRSPTGPDQQGRVTLPERQANERSGPDVKVPPGWSIMDDKLFGTQVAVPPGWTPRFRGDAALCVEPDELARAAAFFVPILLGKQGRGVAMRPDALADGFDEMLRRGLPDLRTQATGRPTGESVQRDLAVTISGTPVVGSYRAVVGRLGTAFVMGYLAPTDHVERLRQTFYDILASYRYTGPRMQLKPFKSAAVELRIPPGWQVQTSEGTGSSGHDIDWQVFCPQVPGARAFMFSPKYISPNWVSDLATGQPDPYGLGIWQRKGYQLANIASDEQALRMALEATLPGLQIVRQQSLDEIRDLLSKVFGIVVQTAQMTGGRVTWYVYELYGRRQVQGVEMRSVVFLSMCSSTMPGGIKGTLGMWPAQVRGFEAPAAQFAQLAPMLDRVCGSFTYTLWWIREVQGANAKEAETIRKFWAHSNRIDKEIWDNHMKTQGAIHEMMYDHLTENYGYVNKETGTIEKIPTEHMERFRRNDGEIVSPEDVIDKQIPVNQAAPVREAWADDYMSFDRRVQVWP